jgi:hypothetical protein
MEWKEILQSGEVDLLSQGWEHRFCAMLVIDVNVVSMKYMCGLKSHKCKFGMMILVIPSSTRLLATH